MVLSRFFGMVFHADVEKKNSFFLHTTPLSCTLFSRRTTIVRRRKNFDFQWCQFFLLSEVVIAFIKI